MDKFEKQAEIRALRNLLEQNDYTARKVVFEIAEAFAAQFPNVKLPVFEKYKAREAEANGYRARIDELMNELENLIE